MRAARSFIFLPAVFPSAAAFSSLLYLRPRILRLLSGETTRLAPAERRFDVPEIPPPGYSAAPAQICNFSSPPSSHLLLRSGFFSPAPTRIERAGKAGKALDGSARSRCSRIVLKCLYVSCDCLSTDDSTSMKYLFVHIQTAIWLIQWLSQRTNDLCENN